MDDGIRLHELTDPDTEPALLQRAFDVVLRPSFTEAELPSVDALHPGHLSGHDQTVIIATDADGPAGVAVYSRAADAPVGILNYLATRPGERGRGLGGRLLTRLQESARATSVQVVLGEVHDPRWYDEADDEHPEARLRFYGRHGALALDRPWIQPSLAPGVDRVRHMLLLAVVHRPSLVEDGVPTQWLFEWAEDYFGAEEGRVPDDAEYLELVARLSTGSTAELLPVDEIDEIDPLGGD